MYQKGDYYIPDDTVSSQKKVSECVLQLSLTEVCVQLNVGKNKGFPAII